MNEFAVPHSWGRVDDEFLSSLDTETLEGMRDTYSHQISRLSKDYDVSVLVELLADVMQILHLRQKVVSHG